jgi:hypothetical protein
VPWAAMITPSKQIQIQALYLTREAMALTQISAEYKFPYFECFHHLYIRFQNSEVT